jgi:hypothetical protein
MTTLRRAKLAAARALARVLELRQIHIVGCARSGTTMAQFAMVAFDGVRIAPQETAVNYPGLGDLLRMRARREIGGGPGVLVTKRGFRWHEPDQLTPLIQRIKHEDLGLIYLVRDPRDVLTSLHAGNSSQTSYLSPERWLASVKAGDRLLHEVGGLDRTLVLRYEDFALRPEQVQRRLEQAFGLALRPGAASLSELEENLSAANYRVPRNMELAMNRIRRIDASSVGRWRRAAHGPTAFEEYPAIRADLEDFIARFGFDLDESKAGQAARPHGP